MENNNNNMFSTINPNMILGVEFLVGVLLGYMAITSVLFQLVILLTIFLLLLSPFIAPLLLFPKIRAAIFSAKQKLRNNGNRQIPKLTQLTVFFMGFVIGIAIYGVSISASFENGGT